MVFAANQEQNLSLIFKDMLLQPDKSDIIISIIEAVESRKYRDNWTLMKNS